MRATTMTARVAERRRIGWLVLVFAAAMLAALLTPTPAHAAAGHAARHAGKDVTNGRIAFVHNGKIFTVNDAGGDQVQLTTTGVSLRPHFSPNGNRIAYIHGNSKKGWDVWVMGANGGNQTQVTHLGNVREAQWSPDGQWLAFGPTLSKIRSTAPFGDPVPLLGDLGSGPEELSVDVSLAWSPDGNHIAYYSHQFPDSPDNYLLILTISTGEVIEFNAVGGSCCGEGFFGNPDWSPDGTQLAYETMVFFPEDGEHRTRPHVEIDNVKSFSDSGYPSAAGDKDPDFAPNGQRLVFSNVDTSGNLSVWVGDRNGTNRQLIAHGYQPDWQPRITTG
jgi:Tol biopolymer transport system component